LSEKKKSAHFTGEGQDAGEGIPDRWGRVIIGRGRRFEMRKKAEVSDLLLWGVESSGPSGRKKWSIGDLF